MKKCAYCGRENEDDAVHCRECGTTEFEGSPTVAAPTPGEPVAEQSRRPRSHADELGEGVVCEMVRLKQAHRHWGPRKIRELYLRKHGTAASESSFKRVLERAGLTEPRRRRVGAAQAGRRWSGQRAQGPNEVWTVDIKGWWYDVEGRRCDR